MDPAHAFLLISLLVSVSVAAGCQRQLAAYAQCGGISNCQGSVCSDQEWPGTCCPPEQSCIRSNSFYYQCLPRNGAQPQQPAGNNAPPSNAVKQGANTVLNGVNAVRHGGNTATTFQWDPAAVDPWDAADARLNGASNTPRNTAKNAVNAAKNAVNAAKNAPQNGVNSLPTPPAPVAAKKKEGSYDYGQVLGLSLMFYEAQRSGKLPANNRIKWRGDSGLKDQAPDGRDVTGGWYDAGDNVKFNLPMAWSTAVLAWSLVDFEAGYKAAGQYQIALDAIKWVTDYFIKCIGDGDNIVVQVGNGAQDHGVWGRPEDVPGPVPVYVVTPDKPGADVVGAMGAALAAASVAFKKVNPKYSESLLAASLKAYKFASSYPGKYSVAVPDAAAFYPSSNWMDDVAFNALWLYIRTGEAKYKEAGLSWYLKHYAQEDGKGVWNNFDWDSNSWGAALLLSRLYPSNALVTLRLEGFVKAWTRGTGGVTYTPKGLAYSGPWGSLRHVGNALFLMKAYARGKLTLSASEKHAIDCTVKKQLGYILGDTGRSFVVGYGTNPPSQPHHRASSCPSPLSAICSWDAFNSKDPNPQTLFGALVGGPGADDGYTDARNDFVKNEVATDYNAGFTGALAAAEQGLKC